MEKENPKRERINEGKVRSNVKKPDSRPVYQAPPPPPTKPKTKEK